MASQVLISETNALANHMSTLGLEMILRSTSFSQIVQIL